MYIDIFDTDKTSFLLYEFRGIFTAEMCMWQTTQILMADSDYGESCALEKVRLSYGASWFWFEG